MRSLACSLVETSAKGHQSDTPSLTSDFNRATAAINGVPAVLHGAARLVRRDII